MERKRLVIAITVGLALILLYSWGIRLLDQKYGWNQPQQQSTSGQANPPSQPATGPSTRATATTTQASGPTIAAAPPTGAQVVPATQQAASATLGSGTLNDGTYALQLRTQPVGAGIDVVTLNRFYKAARSDDLYTFENALPRRLDAAPLVSRAITVNGTTYDLNAVQWGLEDEAKDHTRATYAAELVDGNRRLLKLTKSYRIFKRSDANEGYEIRVDFGFENLTDKPLTIRTAFNGSTLPPGETNRAGDRQFVAGYQVDTSTIDVGVHAVEELKPDKDNGQINLTNDSKNRPAVWAGTESNYFGAVVLPLPMTGGSGKADYISKIVAQGVNIDSTVPTNERQAFVTFETSDIKIAPSATVTLPMSVFLGPKWRKVLDTAYYNQYPREYRLMLIIRSGMCAICTWDWLVGLIVWLLTGIHFLFRDWGLAIIGLVAIVRLLLHPITRQSQISMSKMSKLGPEMERLKKKYGDDKEALNKAMIDFHKQQGLRPYLGCLPMFLQMPIWIALYGVLQTTFELRQAPFLWGFTWIKDLSQPDYLIKFSHSIPLLFGFQMDGFNLLPVFLAVVMFIQSQFMPKPVAATKEQIQQQRMMQWLSPAMFLLFFYNLPSGLNLYIFTSTAVGIIESKIVRDHLKAREEAEKAGRVLVETKPTRGSKRGRNDQPDEPPRGGLAGWLAQRWGKLLQHAENVRQEQERRGKKKA